MYVWYKRWKSESMEFISFVWFRIKMRRWKKLFFGFTILSILHKIKKRNNKFGQMVIEGHNSKCISCSHFHLTFLSNLGELKFVGLGGKSPTPFSSSPFSLNQIMETPIFPSIFSPTFPSSYQSNLIPKQT